MNALVNAPLTSEDFERILVTLWVSGGNPDRRLAEQYGYDLSQHEAAFTAELERRQSTGEVVHITGQTGEQLISYRAHAEGTLREIVEPCIADSSLSNSSRGFMKTAMRFWFNLSGTCQVSDIYSACEAVPLREIYRLPEAIYDAGIAAGKANLALNWRSHLRAAMARTAARCPIEIALPIAWCTLKNDVTHRMLTALADIWAEGKEPSIDALSRAGGPNPASIQRRVNEMEAGGRAALQAHEKRGRTLVWINFTDLDPEGATLSDPVTSYLASAEHTKRSKRALLTALRTALDVPRTSEHDVLNACSKIAAKRLHGWANLIQTNLVEEGKADRKQARSYASAIRVALRWAAANRFVPMFFGDRSADVWLTAKNEWIPTTPGYIAGASRTTRYNYRASWSWLEEAARDLYGDVLPEDITAEMGDEVLDWHKERGRFDRVGMISGMLNWLGKQSLGPRAGLRTARDGDPLLKGEGSCGCANYDRFLTALDFNDLPGEWREFFTWYREFSTLPWEDLALHVDGTGRRRFPNRSPGRELGPSTLHSRTKAVRWVLGISLDFLSINLSTLTLGTAFSKAHLERVFARGQQLWKIRHDAGELTSPYGTSIQQYVVGAGLIAEALYERSRHEAGHEVAIIADRKGKGRAGVDAVAEEGVAKTREQQVLWDGYRLSRERAGNLQRSAEEFGSAANKNTQKDIAEIIRKTPPDWYWDVFQRSLELARRSLQTDGEGEEHHRLIRDVYAFGLLLSTGMRGQEMADVRLDLQYPEREWGKGGGDRVLTLHRKDRKNDRGHVCVVREVFVPGWLESAYLKQSRRWLMRNLRPTTQRWGLERGEVHQHLIVDNGGEALGSVEEIQDRSGRDPMATEIRVNWFRDTWKNRFGRIAWEHCGRKCPTGDGEFTLHTIRNVQGYYLYQRARIAGEHFGELHPAMVAANYLGDNPQMVQDTYGGIDASLIDSSIFERMGDWGTVQPPPISPDDGPSGGDLSTPEPGASLFDRLRSAREEILKEASGWGLSDTEVDAVWEDRRRNIMAKYNQA